MKQKFLAAAHRTNRRKEKRITFFAIECDSEDQFTRDFCKREEIDEFPSFKYGEYGAMSLLDIKFEVPEHLEGQILSPEQQLNLYGVVSREVG